MKRNTIIILMIILGALTLQTSVTFADSSWIWISEKRPYDVLPIVVVLTLVIEILSIYWIARIDKFRRVFLSVTAANLASFLLPFIITLVSSAPVHPYPDSLDDYHNIIDVGYLMFTIIMEFPIVYCTLRRHTNRRKLLAAAIIVVNAVTTVMVYMIEQKFCQGYYV